MTDEAILERARDDCDGGGFYQINGVDQPCICSEPQTASHLSDEDREALAYLHEMVNTNTRACQTKQTRDALAVLERLLGDKP